MNGKTFLKIARVTLVFIYLIILAGSVVRMTGSGMGCPDWPKCFDCWIPPTEESQLPENYREDFAERREAKIEKFADLLTKVGFGEAAEEIRNDESLREKEAPFNAFKTWTEYINRLVGFVSGNLVLLLFASSLIWFRKDRRLVFLCFLNLLVIGITAWMGSIVVATNIVPWVLTVHMLMALIIIAIQIAIIGRMKNDRREHKPVNGTFKILLLIALTLSLVEIIFGTQVRQSVDHLHKTVERAQIIDQIGFHFEFHRTFAIAVILINGLLFYTNYKQGFKLDITKWLIILICIEALCGIILVYGGLPKEFQPIHVTLATIMFGIQSYLLTEVFGRRKRLF